MIVAEGIRKSYGPLHVLQSVDLSIGKGEIVSIVGASGAGKSTLLHVLGTLDGSDSGKVSIDGNVVSNLSGNKLARFRNNHIGFVFQSHHLLPEFTARENIMMPALIAGKSSAEAGNKADELLQKLGLGNRGHHRPSELSGGEQQRVAVARALINDPSVIFADEPSGNLDSVSARSLHDLFFDIRREKGITFVIVTHNEELAAMADRKLVMKDGRIAE
ncbi:MAG: ABC transporter ATP-binding protein [Bacteroidota bacterium]